jgi:hypothetical protein
MTGASKKEMRRRKRGNTLPGTMVELKSLFLFFRGTNASSPTALQYFVEKREWREVREAAGGGGKKGVRRGRDHAGYVSTNVLDWEEEDKECLPRLQRQSVYIRG